MLCATAQMCPNWSRLLRYFTGAKSKCNSHCSAFIRLRFRVSVNSPIWPIIVGCISCGFVWRMLLFPRSCWHCVFIALAPPRPGRRLFDLGRWSVVRNFTGNDSHDHIRWLARIHWRHFPYLDAYCGFYYCFLSVGSDGVVIAVPTSICQQNHHSSLSLRCLRAPASFVAKKVVQPRKPAEDRRRHVPPDVRKQLLEKYSFSTEAIAAHFS